MTTFDPGQNISTFLVFGSVLTSKLIDFFKIVQHCKLQQPCVNYDVQPDEPRSSAFSLKMNNSWMVYVCIFALSRIPTFVFQGSHDFLKLPDVDASKELVIKVQRRQKLTRTD